MHGTFLTDLFPGVQLRAATRLCRLPQDSADAQQSRRLLESVYATFAEGFTTADLSEARELLKG